MARLDRVVRRLRLVHPFPSFVNAALVFGLAGLAASEVQPSLTLAAGMLGLQFAIGALNDLADADLDAVAKPWKPIPAGLVARGTAAWIVIIAGGGGLALAATAGLPVLAMAVAMLGCGVAYDLWLKPTAFAWACFSLAFTILPVYAWYGATGELPPRPEFLLPLAALAGPLIHISNGLADLEGDRGAGLMTLATRLGRRGGLFAVVALVIVIHGLAWLTLPAAAPPATALVATASLIAVAALTLTAARSAAGREAGWMLQALSIALLGLGWVAAAG